MGRVTVKVPDVGEGVAEVELVAWAVTEGQSVERNQVVAEVMTDKATVEVPCPTDGVLRQAAGAPGDRLLVGETLFVLEVEGEGDTEVEAVQAPAPAPPPTASSPPPVSSSPPPPTHRSSATTQAGPTTASPEATTPPPGSDGAPPGGDHAPIRAWSPAAPAPRPEGRKPTATPSVRRRARAAGVDLRTVPGSGPAGRITHDDLDELFRRPSGPLRQTGGGTTQPNTSVADQPVIGLRRRIAEQMVASSSTIPHITYVDEVDMTALEELRKALNQRNGDAGPRLTILPFLVRALVRVLPSFPMCNAHLLDQGQGPDTLRTYGGIHVGIATQTDGGLVVPVLRHAETHSLLATATFLAELAEGARAGRLGPADLAGSTITITSLGALGGVVTTPVINKPETTIVGVNKLATRPVWDGERFVPRQMMNLSSSFDHRVVDGWDAANFVQAVKALLEQPALLFVDDHQL